MNDSTAPALRLTGLHKAVAVGVAIDGIDLEIAQGEVFCLLGEPGGDKGTLLRVLAGLLPLDAGSIELHGEDIGAWPAHRRPINMMFPSYGLFPHLDVGANIRFGLQREGLAKAQVRERTEEVLALLDVAALVKRKPHQLSAADQLRVALARCLAKRPRVLLLEEPLARLGRQQQEQAQLELMRLQGELGITIVVQTDDPELAMAIGQRIGILRAGRLVQIGTPAQIYDTPASHFVAELGGALNVFVGQVTGESEAGFSTVNVEGMRDDLQVTSAAPLAVGDSVTVVIRPESLRFLNAQDRLDETFVSNAFEARVRQHLFRGGRSAYVVAIGERSLQVSVAHGTQDAKDALPKVDERVRVAFPPASAWVLPQ